MYKSPLPVQTADEELVPAYSTPFASGADLRAAVATEIVLAPGTSAVIPTGIRVEIPEGYEIQIRPRSGFAAKNQLTVLNTPGTIDSDYRGEICVILINLGKEPFSVLPKMRIAQLVLSPVVQADFIRTEQLNPSKRGEGRFGHTGAH
jgi:dUTP pyrophosphatase